MHDSLLLRNSDMSAVLVTQFRSLKSHRWAKWALPAKRGPGTILVLASRSCQVARWYRQLGERTMLSGIGTSRSFGVERGLESTRLDSTREPR